MVSWRLHAFGEVHFDSVQLTNCFSVACIPKEPQAWALPLHCLWDQGYCILDAFLGHFFFYYIKMWQVGKKRNLAYLIIFPYLYTQLHGKSLSSSAGLPYGSRSFLAASSPFFLIHRNIQGKKGWYLSCTLVWAVFHSWHQKLLPACPKDLSTPEHTLVTRLGCRGMPVEVSALPHCEACCFLPHLILFFSFCCRIKDSSLLPLTFFHKLFSV